MCGVAAPVLVIMNCTLPPKSAVSAGASPANGTCTALFCGSPARWSKLIVAKWLRRAISAGRIIELTGPVPHNRDQLADAADRQVLAHQQHQRGVGHQHYRREVLDRVVSEIALERRHRGVGAGGGHDEGMAVGESLLCGHDADQAGRAGALIADDRPALPYAATLGDDPGYAVIRSAGGQGLDEEDEVD